jgi:DNA topoisomerase-1
MAVPVFEVTAGNGLRYVITSAIGHLYGLRDAAAARSVYPSLDLEWAPVPKNKRAEVAIKVISDLAGSASSFVHACDYDQEGEVIGYSILEYACKGKYARSKRAKFSTLTDDEIRDAFARLADSPNAGMADAGRSRHMLDFLYGVNLSRALSQSFKSTGSGYRNLSVGRVQGPALRFIVDREAELNLHIADPYWAVKAELAKEGEKFYAHYVKARIDTLAEAEAIQKACGQSAARVTGVESRRVALRPPTPFNTGDLQREAYRIFKLSPGYTLAIAERLYLRAMISYPRTSSQKLPPSIGYAKIISGLSRIAGYSRAASILLSKPALVPNEGRMSDPAHPAIYPTGVSAPGKLDGLSFKVYDLIVRRFLSTFAGPAIVQRTDVSIDLAGYGFAAEGATVLYGGWTEFYRPYAPAEEQWKELPPLKAGDELENRGLEVKEKFTEPPRRYNQATLLAQMEDEGIGTKSTRAEIIATLFKRNYVSLSRKGMAATDLGIAVIESMEDYAPSIVSTELTRKMEAELEKIESGAVSSVSAIEGAVDLLLESLKTLVEQEPEVGGSMRAAVSSDGIRSTAIGSCPVCGTGELRIITSWKTKKRFVGCSNYAQAAACRASMPLPQKGGIRPSGKRCAACGWPVIGIVYARRARQWRICVNMSCPSKKRPAV